MVVKQEDSEITVSTRKNKHTPTQEKRKEQSLKLARIAAMGMNSPRLHFLGPCLPLLPALSFQPV